MGADRQPKSASCSKQRGIGKRVVVLSSDMATEPTLEKWVHLKKLRFPHVFRIPLHPIPNPSPCPGTREPISVAIPFDLLRKKRAIRQKANDSNGKTKMDKRARRRELPCACRLILLIEGESFVVQSQCRWKEKKWWRSKEQARKGINVKSGTFVARSGVWESSVTGTQGFFDSQTPAE
jgi:hypothetical protein